MGRWRDGEIARFFKKGRVRIFFTYKFLKICIKIHNKCRYNSPHFSLFPSWEGLGVGSDSRFPTPDSRFPDPLYIDIANWLNFLIYSHYIHKTVV
ncbi:MAG: hypothetical protein F6K63_07635 [Moorea sp. SIO1G6]|uniref:hypothetical protein n=1 Tax=Moorena sp. SIO1G6 TaxID=2607840 RepID=UPI0013BF5E0D|nr:hypothetical protein [Moorena sp. SIO1G6]NET64265.1 hypothetical protein [Moorena sp. SIO1G6]